jgi:glycosyltransferase WbpL
VTQLLLGLAAAAASALLTAGVRRLAITRALLDIPNQRSLHETPTPRAGGLAIALVVLTALLWLGVQGDLARPAAIGLIGAAVIVAGTGWVDDLRTLPAAIRVVAQVVAAVWFLGWIGGVQEIRLATGPVSLGVAGQILALVTIVWSINLYNFMDGIDGLAGGQAVVVGVIGAVQLRGPMPGLSAVCAAIAGASLGFLLWNWAPARIFMGDVGSGLLGFLFAAIAILSATGSAEGGPSFLTWVTLGGVFVFDATVTLLRRMKRGERWYQAHRSHAYQRLVQAGWSHRRVTMAALAMTLVLGGLGAIGIQRPDLRWVAAGAGLALLLGSYLWVERRRPM